MFLQKPVQNFPFLYMSLYAHYIHHRLSRLPYQFTRILLLHQLFPDFLLRLQIPKHGIRNILPIPSPRRRFVLLEVSQPQEQRRFPPGVLPTNNSFFSIFREVTNQTPLFSVLTPQKPRLLSNRSLLPRTRHPISSKKRTTTENTTSGTFFLLSGTTPFVQEPPYPYQPQKPNRPFIHRHVSRKESILFI